MRITILLGSEGFSLGIIINQDVMRDQSISVLKFPWREENIEIPKKIDLPLTEQ